VITLLDARRCSSHRSQGQILVENRYFCPNYGSLSGYCHNAWYRKTRMVHGYPTVKNFEDLFTRYGRMYERDRQTNTARRHRPRQCTASRGKKRLQQLWNFQNLQEMVSLNASGGSTVQCGEWRGLLCLTPMYTVFARDVISCKRSIYYGRSVCLSVCSFIVLFLSHQTAWQNSDGIAVSRALDTGAV